MYVCMFIYIYPYIYTYIYIKEAYWGGGRRGGLVTCCLTLEESFARHRGQTRVGRAAYIFIFIYYIYI